MKKSQHPRSEAPGDHARQPSAGCCATSAAANPCLREVERLVSVVEVLSATHIDALIYSVF